jgi:spore maturation protein CgeB
MQPRFNCVFLGLSITSTWGNGHATTYRGLIKEFSRRGHSITFLERDVPWYAENREFDHLPYCRIILYSSLEELKDRYTGLIRSADLIIVGSYVPEGIAVGRWVTSIARSCCAFYDIDTPVTLANLGSRKCEYIAPDLYPKYHLYLSFTGGPALHFIEQRLGSPCARALYCSVDPFLYYPEAAAREWDLAYLGTYASDRQPSLQRLLLDVASSNPDRKFAVAGPQYPEDIIWPENVYRTSHLPALEHRSFYNSQSFTLNLTRKDMVRVGYSPSVRLFEAAACGTPILTDIWPGLETIFTPGREILPVRTAADVTSYLQMPDEQRHEIGDRGRKRALRFHTAAVRAEQLEAYVLASLEDTACSKGQGTAVKAAPSPALL